MVFLWVAPGAYASLPEGRQDNTHFGPQGAWTMARIAVQGFRGLGLGLGRHLETAGAEVRFTVTNPAPFDRPLETVELPWAQLRNAWGYRQNDVEVADGRCGRQPEGRPRGRRAGGVVFCGFRAGERFARATQEYPCPESPTVAKYVFGRCGGKRPHAFRIYGGPLAGDVRNGIDAGQARPVSSG
jgi:hypothetical protein